MTIFNRWKHFGDKNWKWNQFLSSLFFSPAPSALRPSTLMLSWSCETFFRRRLSSAKLIRREESWRIKCNWTSERLIWSGVVKMRFLLLINIFFAASHKCNDFFAAASRSSRRNLTTRIVWAFACEKITLYYYSVNKNTEFTMDQESPRNLVSSVIHTVAFDTDADVLKIQSILSNMKSQ